jgi:serine/threonine protein kinase
MPLSPGDRLGLHEILSLIGKGGMGEVDKACDTRIDRIVALKVSAAQVDKDYNSFVASDRVLTLRVSRRAVACL